MTGLRGGRVSYGPTALIDPSCRVVEQLTLMEVGTLVVDVPLLQGLSRCRPCGHASDRCSARAFLSCRSGLLGSQESYLRRVLKRDRSWHTTHAHWERAALRLLPRALSGGVLGCGVDDAVRLVARLKQSRHSPIGPVGAFRHFGPFWSTDSYTTRNDDPKGGLHHAHDPDTGTPLA